MKSNLILKILVWLLFFFDLKKNLIDANVNSTQVNKRVVKRAIGGKRWPKNEIAYEISKYFTSNNHLEIENALKEFERALTVDNEKCIKFVDRKYQWNRLSSSKESKYTDFISFETGNKCNSQVGYYSGSTSITLGDDCFTPGIIQHEIMHA